MDEKVPKKFLEHFVIVYEVVDEDNYTLGVYGSLDKAMAAAEAEFKKVNENRRDPFKWDGQLKWETDNNHHQLQYFGHLGYHHSGDQERFWWAGIDVLEWTVQ